MVALVACCGIQHPQLLLHRDDDGAARSLCRERWAFIGGRYHSNACSFVVDPGVPKQRCAKCTSAYSNIRPARYPLLFPEQATVTAALVADPPAATCPAAVALAVEPPTVTVPIVQLILPDEGAVRCRLLELVETVDEDADLAKHEEISLLARALKLKGRHVFELDDQRAFTVCDGDDCNACSVKKKRANVRTICTSCNNRRKKSKLQSVLKVAPDNIRVVQPS